MHHRILQIGLITAFGLAAAAHVLVACTSLAAAHDLLPQPEVTPASDAVSVGEPSQVRPTN